MGEMRMFPIIGGPSIPWAVIEPHEGQAIRNHDQTIERLAQRGGLSPCEALHVLKSEPFDWKRKSSKEQDAKEVAELEQYVRDHYYITQTESLRAALLAVAEAWENGCIRVQPIRCQCEERLYSACANALVVLEGK